MKSVEDLDVFKLAHQLALKTYSTNKTFPSAETFRLVDQVQANCWDNDLNGAKRLNGWNDWNGCSFIHRVLIVRDGHEHGSYHVPWNSLNVEMTIFLVPAGGEVP